MKCTSKQSGILTLLLLLTKSATVFSQQFIGATTIHEGAGLYSVYQNPANVTNDSFKFRLHLLTAGMDLNNNYVKYAAPFSMLDLVRGKNDRPLEMNDLVEIHNNKPLKTGTLSGELRGPAFAFRLGPQTQMAIMSRMRSAIQITDASPEFLTVVRLGLGNYSNYMQMGFAALNAATVDNQFKAVSQAYSEWAVSLGHTFLNDGRNSFKAGITVKRFFAYGGGYIHNKNLRYSIEQETENPDQLYMNIEDIQTDVAYVSNNTDKFLSWAWLFGNNSPGKGWGMDLGFTYELRDDETSPPIFKLGVAVTDIGNINYNGENVNRYSISDQNKKINEETWRSYTTPMEGESVFSNLSRKLTENFNLVNGVEQRPFKMGIPTSLNLSVDTKIVGSLYLSAIHYKGIYNKSSMNWRQTGFTAIVPRLEGRKLSVAMPIMLQNGGTGIGLTLRMGPLMLGSDNLSGFFARNGSAKAQGVNVYGGLSFGIGQ